MKKPPDLPCPRCLPHLLVIASLPDFPSPPPRNLLALTVRGSHPSPFATTSHQWYGLDLSRLGSCSSPWLRFAQFLGTACLGSHLTVQGTPSPIAAPAHQWYGLDLSRLWSCSSPWLRSALSSGPEPPGSPLAADFRHSPLLYEGMRVPPPSDLRSCPLSSPRYVLWYRLCIV